MINILIVYIISWFISVVITDVIFHCGNLTNVMIGTYIFQFIILFIMKKFDFKKIFGKIKIKKEIFFWSLNYLIATIFTILMCVKYFGEKAIGSSFANVDKLSTLVLISIVIPILEEVFYRGIICNELLKKHSKLLTILISGIVFATNNGLIKGVIFVLLGSTFYKSYIYIKTKSLYNSIIIHMINNIVISLIVYYSNSVEEYSLNISIEYSFIFYILGGLSIIACVYNYYRMYKNLKINKTTILV